MKKAGNEAAGGDLKQQERIDDRVAPGPGAIRPKPNKKDVYESCNYRG